MNPDSINWTLAVMLLLAIATPVAVWIRHPEALRRIASHCLARADAVEQSRAVYERSLKRWSKQLRIPDLEIARPRPALETRSNDV